MNGHTAMCTRNAFLETLRESRSVPDDETTESKEKQ